MLNVCKTIEKLFSKICTGGRIDKKTKPDANWQGGAAGAPAVVNGAVVGAAPAVCRGGAAALYSAGVQVVQRGPGDLPGEEGALTAAHRSSYWSQLGCAPGRLGPPGSEVIRCPGQKIACKRFATLFIKKNIKEIYFFANKFDFFENIYFFG